MTKLNRTINMQSDSPIPTEDMIVAAEKNNDAGTPVPTGESKETVNTKTTDISEQTEENKETVNTEIADDVTQSVNTDDTPDKPEEVNGDDADAFDTIGDDSADGNLTDEQIRETFASVEHLINVIMGGAENAKDFFSTYVKSIVDRGLDDDGIDMIQNMKQHINRNFVNNDNERLQQIMLEELKKNGRVLKSIDDYMKFTTKMKTKSTVVSGNMAKIAVLSRVRGVMKIYLVNTGIWIDISPSSLLELSDFYSSVDLESEEYGRILGGYYYTVQDIHIKTKIAEMIKRVVVNSNLVNWDEGDTLLETISYQDYDTIVWGMAALLFPKGVNIAVTCSDISCDYINKSLKVDVKALRKDVIDDLTEKQLEILLDSKLKTVEDVEKYKLSLDENTETTFTETLNGAKVKYHYQTPSIARVLDIGKIIISKLTKTIRGDFNINDVEVRNKVTYSAYTMYAPWIRSIEFLTAEDEIDFVVEDNDGLFETLNITQQDSIGFRDSIMDFIAHTRHTYICYSMMECPKCHKKPETSIDDYTPVDAQQLFFSLACQALLLAELH